jgi:hypothetical protein
MGKNHIEFAVGELPASRHKPAAESTPKERGKIIGITNSGSFLQHGIKRWLQITWIAADDPLHLGRRGLLLQRLGELPRCFRRECENMYATGRTNLRPSQSPTSSRSRSRSVTWSSCACSILRNRSRLLKRKWFPRVFEARHDFALTGDVLHSLEHMALNQFKMSPEHAAGSSTSAVSTVDEIE